MNNKAMIEFWKTNEKYFGAESITDEQRMWVKGRLSEMEVLNDEMDWQRFDADWTISQLDIMQLRPNYTEPVGRWFLDTKTNELTSDVNCLAAGFYKLIELAPEEIPYVRGFLRKCDLGEFVRKDYGYGFVENGDSFIGWPGAKVWLAGGDYLPLPRTRRFVRKEQELKSHCRICKQLFTPPEGAYYGDPTVCWKCTTQGEKYLQSSSACMVEGKTETETELRHSPPTPRRQSWSRIAWPTWLSIRTARLLPKGSVTWL